jgi:HSP20 family protein
MAVKKKVAISKKGKKGADVATGAKPAYLEPFSSLRHEIDRVFENFLGHRPHTWPRFPDLLEEFEHPFRELRASLDMSEISPKVDITENDDAYIITAELAGINEDDIELNLVDGILTLKGEKREEREEERGYHVSERRYGAFRRTFRLPSGVDDPQVSAEFDKGVITVTLPKTGESKEKARKIEVKKKE